MITARLALLSALFALGSPLAYGEDLRPLSEQESATIEWFEGLGFGDLSRARFIRARTGDWDIYGKSVTPFGNYIGTYYGHEGFLISEGATELRILTRLLREVTIPIGSDPPVFKQRRDLRRVVLALLNQPPPTSRIGSTDLAHGAQLWFMGYACLRQGHDKLARELFDASKKDFRDLVGDLKREISHAAMWRAAVAIGNASISRKQLVEIHGRFLERFPQSQHAERARETSRTLERMVEEDEEYAARPRKAWDDMLVDEKIADAIFRLRDQTGHQLSEPGACSIFMSFGGSNSLTPADQLAAIGPPAIPALIRTIGDKRFSRANGRHRSFYFSEYTLRIEDCALRTISRISGKPFYRKGRESDEELRARLNDWWEAFASKGERQALIDEVASGGDDAARVATRLVEKYPDAALDAIRRGVKGAKTPWIRSRLVDAACSLGQDATKLFLLEQLAKGQDVETRLAAARGLERSGESEKAVAGILEAWRALRLDSLEAGDSTSGGFRDRTAAELVRFVVEHGDADAVEALGEGLSDHTLERRVSTVRSLGGQAKKLVDPLQGAGATRMLTEIERVLLAALADEGQTRVSGSVGGVRFKNPRVCDFAAHALSLAFPDRYTFNLSAAEPERDRLLTVMRGRATNGDR